MRTFSTLPALALTTLALASGCGQVKPNEGPDQVAASKATLHRSRDCNELTADLRADTIAKINKQIDSMIAAVRDCRTALGADADLCGAYYGGYGRSVSEDSMAGAEPPRAAGEPTGGGEGTGSSDFGAGSPSYSETNTQVQGVDEADIVKSDGQRLFVLHGSTFRVLQAYPLAALTELGVTDIEGSPTEMYVEDGVAVIYSQVDGTPVYAAAGVAAPSRGYGGREPNVEPPVAPGGGSYGGYSANPLTKITVLRIAPDFSTSVAKETYLEGNYLSSRRVDRHVRTVLQGQGSTDLSGQLLNSAAEDLGLDENSDVLSSLELVRSVAIAKVGQLGLDRWLPRTFEKQGANVSAKTLACGDAYTPTSGTTQDGLTEVSTLDLSNLAAATQEVAIFGQAGTVYGNAGTLYVAASGYSDMPFGGGVVGVASSGSGGGSAPSTPPPDSTSPAPEARSGNIGLRDVADKRIARPELPEVITLTKTHVHKFTFSAEGTPVYVSSGTVDGAVQNQFSLDERDGILRIATTEQRMYRSDFEGGNSRSDDLARPRSLTHVFALETSAGELTQKGAVKDLAPNEQIYSVRFVGPKAYVVTFRQVDPLFVLDFANPSAPSKLGELKIPGFSEYMHPLDENHLLTIGKEADASGRVQGMALQIFDVSNPTAPQQKQKFVYSPSSYGYSEASYNHKAFTYFAEKNLLAFPYTSYDQNTGRQSSTLELFKVGTSDGFTRLGGIDHSAFFSEQQSSCYYVDPTVRRGLFIEDVAYSLSYGGVIAKRIDDLAGAGVSLALPSPYPQASGGCDAPGKPSGG